eukprot:7410700-Pyramimonas_sp.AAC.1
MLALAMWCDGLPLLRREEPHATSPAQMPRLDNACSQAPARPPSARQAPQARQGQVARRHGRQARDNPQTQSQPLNACSSEGSGHGQAEVAA